MILRLLFVIFACAFGGCAPNKVSSLHDLGVKDWSELQAELAPAVPKTIERGQSAYSYILESQTATKIHRLGTPSLWMKMCRSGEPYSSLLGYRCILEKSPKDSFEAALTTLASGRGTSLVFYSKPLQEINETESNVENKNSFTHFVTNPDNDELALEDVTAFLGGAFLHDWAVSCDLATVPAPVQYLAVGQVYARKNEQSRQIPKSVSDVFDSFERQQGNRLATFVKYAPENVGIPRLRNAIERLLGDEDVSAYMYQFALHRHVEFIKKHLDASKLQFSPTQKDRLDDLMGSVIKSDGGITNE